MSEFLNLLREWSREIVSIVFLLAHIVGALSAWHAVLRSRTSQSAIAWAVGLVSLPLLVVPLYWIFGRNRFTEYRDAMRRVERDQRSSAQAVRRALATNRNADGPDKTPVGRMADVLDTPLTGGNRVELLIDGDEFFEELDAVIRSATQYLYVQFFIIRDDRVGNQFADALCERAEAGVMVRLVYDEIGSFALSREYLDRLTKAGVDVHPFGTRTSWKSRFTINFRNHRKLVVVDGRHAIVSGLNVGNEYRGETDQFSHWRDTAIRIDGPAVRTLQAVFATDYYWATRQDLPEAIWSGDDDESDPLADQTADATTLPSEAKIAICATGPADQRDRCTMMYASAAASAKDRLWISTPYLVPDDATMMSLSMARARSVDVRILVPEKSDSWFLNLASFHYEKLLESQGIPVLRYGAGFLHQKLVLVDHSLVLIGSTNLDNRSLYLNFELMAAVEDPKLIREAEEMFLWDLAASSDRSSGGEIPPWYIRLGTVIARLFSPIL